MRPDSLEKARVAKARSESGFYATKPTRFTRWTRTFIPWQMIRFVVINLRMMRMISLGHKSRKK